MSEKSERHGVKVKNKNVYKIPCLNQENPLSHLQSICADDTEILVLDSRNGAVESFDLATLRGQIDRGLSSLDAGKVVVSLSGLRGPNQILFSLSVIAFIRSTG